MESLLTALQALAAGVALAVELGLLRKHETAPVLAETTQAPPQAKNRHPRERLENPARSRGGAGD
jgi:hypothetical protein